MSNVRMRWAKISSVISLILLILAVFSLTQFYQTFMDNSYPDTNYVVKLDAGESESIELNESRKLSVFKIDKFADGEHSIRIVRDSGEEFMGNAPVWIDTSRIGSDGQTIYTPVRTYLNINSGIYSIENNADSGSIWIVDDGQLETQLQGNIWTFLFYFGCCLGLPLGLIGIILLIFSRNRKDGLTSDQYIVIQDGNVMVTDEENYNSIINQSESVPEETVPSPFIKEVEEESSAKPVDSSEEKFDEWKSWDDG